MLESKGQSANRRNPETSPASARLPGWLAEFDFLRLLGGFFSAAWTTERMELRPIPVRVRNRR